MHASKAEPTPEVRVTVRLTPYLREAIICPFLADLCPTSLTVRMWKERLDGPWGPAEIDDHALRGAMELKRPAACEAGRKAAHELIEKWKAMP